MFIGLPQIKTRIVRLRQLAEALCREVSRWKGQDGPLTPPEKRRYPDGLVDVIAGLDDARHALKVAPGRLSGRQNVEDVS